MEWLDTGLKILTVVISLIVALLGAQLWRIRSDNRKTNAEASGAEATAGATVAATALTLVQPLGAKVSELNRTVDEWEAYGRQVHTWEAIVVRVCDANGLTLPTAPTPPY